MGISKSERIWFKKVKVSEIRQNERSPTHLNANTATDAKLLGQRRNLRIGSNFDAQLSHPHHRTRSLALLSTSLRLAFVGIDDSDTRLLICLVSLTISRHSVMGASCESMLMMNYNQKNINTSAAARELFTCERLSM